MALFVVQGTVVHGWTIEGWEQTAPGKWGFRGSTLPELDLVKVRGRSVAHLFPPGAANPLRYTTWDVVVGDTSPDEIAIARGDDVAKRAVTDDYLQAMIVREPPSGCSVVPGSTPVVSFGDVSSARVATLGINPSWGEFLTKSGALLAGGKQKLATLESLGLATMSEAGPAQVAEVVDG